MVVLSGFDQALAAAVQTMRLFRVGLIVVSAAFASAALAQTAPDDPATVLDDVVVDGTPLRSSVRSFVGAVAAPALGRGPARWTDALCVGVVNLHGETARLLLDKVSRNGAQLGLTIAAPGCSPNLVVMMTDNGPALARELVQSRRREFLTRTGGATSGEEALAFFQSSNQPIRWWHVSLPINRDTGRATVRLPRQPPFQGMSNGGRTPADYGPLGSTVTASRVTSPVEDRLQQVLVIVDVSRLETVQFDQLADYVSMVGLAQIDPKASTSAFDSILNIFDNSIPAVPGLTMFDWSYLHGLYDAPQVTISARGRAAAVASEMERYLRWGRAPQAVDSQP